MISLTMMGLTPGQLVRALLLFTLMSSLVALETPLVVLETPLVVFVAWGLVFLSRQESSQLVTLFCWSCSYQKESNPKAVNSYKYFGAQSPDFFSYFQNKFCSYSFVLTSSCLFQPLYLIQKHDPEHTNGTHPSVFLIWYQGYQRG